VSQLSAAAMDPATHGVSCGLPEAEKLRESFKAAFSGTDVTAFMLLDRNGLVAAAEPPSGCGRRVRSTAFRARLDEAYDGKAVFVRPYPDVEMGTGAGDATGRPTAWMLVPSRGVEGGVTAVAAVGIRADRALAEVFGSARPGETAEVYAFSPDGLMLSESRFTEEMVPLGLVPESGPRTSIFQVRVRDPGGELATGYQPKVEPDARPLTQPAALGVAARPKTTPAEWEGGLAEPFRNYMGTEVIGAWRWLPAYDMGVTAEISAAEALGPMRYLVTAFAVIAGFLALSLAAALVSSVSLSRLQRQFGRLQRLGAYTLEREINEGGMATIYLARHALLKRPTAVKILKKHVATDEFVARFEREVQLASQLLHPNTVEIYDFGRTREGAPYYVMEYLDGVTLAQLVEYSGPVPAARAIHILRQVCAALREAHLRGIVHRDVKPENVMLCRRGEDDVVKLVDFGLMKNLSRPDTRDLTKQLKVLGTPRYMAPERIANPADVDARSDLYAVGAVGYLLLTGKPIFPGDNDMEITHQVVHAPPPRPSEAAPFGVPPVLDDLLHDCLAKDRAKRPQTAEAMMEILGQLAARHPWAQRDAGAWWRRYRSEHTDAASAEHAKKGR
jgi:serine/threonine-protein kinase